MTEASDQGLSGGCLCGAVRYTVGAPPALAVNCYCTDCRRASGTAHSTHVAVPAEAFVLKGPVSFYESRADSGQMVKRHFCPDCGSPLYSTGDGGSGMVYLRASGLDDPDAVAPQVSVYVSRAPKWDRADPSLPAFPEMPTAEQRRALLAKS